MQKNKIHHSMTAFEWFMLLSLALLWGGSYFFVGVAVYELPTMTIVFARVAFGALALLIALRFLHIALPKSFAIWRMFLMMGLINNVIPFCLIVYGQNTLASGFAAIINASTPMFTILVAHFCTKDEKMSLLKFIGLIVGFFGVVVLIGMDSLSAMDNSFWAAMACIGAAISYAFAGVYGRRFARESIPPMATATGQVCASTIILLPIMLWVDQPWNLTNPSLTTWGALVGIGVLCTACAYSLFFRILSTAGATNLLLVTYLVPVNAIILGVSFLDEPLLSRQVWGMIIICIGMIVIDGRLIKKT